LHNIARSVLILDEVQTLPVHLLEPILDVLAQLSQNYKVTVVFCTATQPALSDSRYLRGLGEVREIVPEPARYFAELKRVDYQLPEPGKRWTWNRVAEEMQTASQALAVVNTKKDAFALLDALQHPASMHLSTQMCGVHRKQTLAEVHRRLNTGEACLLVSTQVVEAGVDLDFPLVLRALGPLDRIVQAAGRCNREGRLASGRVVIFDPAEGSSPPGIYRTGIDTAATLLASGCNLHDPQTYELYFRSLFQAADLDAKGIQELRRAFDFPEVAARFRLIDDDSEPAIVGSGNWKEEVDRLLGMIQRRAITPLRAFRLLQPYVVNIRRSLIPTYQEDGLIQEFIPGLWKWLGGYDSVRGLMDKSRNPDTLVI
jgi:CRISPR-associated endonuclease/helicase Cas3